MYAINLYTAFTTIGFSLIIDLQFLQINYLLNYETNS